MKKRIRTGLFIFVFWIVIWFLLDNILSKKGILFASPIDTLNVFIDQGQTGDFWRAIIYTFCGLAGGYVMSVVLASFAGFYAFFHPGFRKMVSPFLGFFGYIPMISFTVAALIWYKGDNLFIPVSLFLSIPVIYKNTLVAMDNRDKNEMERIQTMKLGFRQKMAYLYRPALMPEYVIGCHRGLSMCWKSGIISQYLSNKGLSIGAFLFTAKDEMDMASIFAWTIIIVALAKLFELIVLGLLSSDYINHSQVTLKDVYDIIEDEEESV